MQQQKNKARIGGLLHGGMKGSSSKVGLVKTNFGKFWVGFK